MKGDNPFTILGVSETADDAAIRRAYRQKARQSHPDNNQQDPTAEENFKRIQAAYEQIQNKEKRQEWQQAQQFAQAPFMGGWYENVPSPMPTNYGFMPISEWPTASFPDNGWEQSWDATQHVRSFQRTVPLTIPWIYALNGGQAVVNVPGRQRQCPTCLGKGCPTCQGSGVIREDTSYKVNIPKGVDNQTKIKLAGKGDQQRNGAIGDLLVQTTLTDMGRWQRHEANVVTKVPITIVEAVNGGNIDVPTLDGGTKTIMLRPGAGAIRQRIRGEGFPFLKNPSHRGDAEYQLVIDTPQLPKPARQQLEALRDVLPNPRKESHGN